jgi:hypothetical protein
MATRETGRERGREGRRARRQLVLVAGAAMSVLVLLLPPLLYRSNLEGAFTYHVMTIQYHEKKSSERKDTTHERTRERRGEKTNTTTRKTRVEIKKGKKKKKKKKKETKTVTTAKQTISLFLRT